MKTKWVTLNKLSAIDVFYVLIMDLDWYQRELPNLLVWFEQNAPELKPGELQYMIAFNREQYTSWQLTWD
jgi:hypothetical protein